MPDTPREGYAGIRSTACERCVFGTGEHARWCSKSADPFDLYYHATDCPICRLARRIKEEALAR